MTDSAGAFGSVDAQYTVRRLFKPQAGFEALYQGVQAVNDTVGLLSALPVPFFEWVDGEPPDPRDPLAGEPGFNPNLLNFAKVPYGCRVKLKIPQIFYSAFPIFYRYMIVQRDSNLARYTRTGVGPYHNPDQRFGARDTFAGAPGEPRFAIPASTRTVVFNRAPSLDVLRGATADLYREWLNVRGVETPFFPLIGPGELGVYQQGIVDPVQDLATGYLATFMEYEFDSTGDEILIVADRECVPSEPANCEFPLWDFSQGAIDQGFSNIYGTNPFGGPSVGGEPPSTPHANFPDSAIQLYTGTAP